MIAGGAAVAITGVVLLVLDLRKARSASTARRDRPRGTMMAPWLTLEGGGGVSLLRRF